MFRLHFIEFFAALLVLASLGFSQYVPPRRKAITLSHELTECSPGTACRFAVCLWDRSLTFNEDTCTILDNNCYCPEGEVCSRTNDFSPRNFLVTYEYKCKNPAEFYIHQGAFYVNPSRLHS